jgi:hypothetical protein
MGKAQDLDVSQGPARFEAEGKIRNLHRKLLHGHTNN